MMIIDAGVHVWRPEAPDRPWMPSRKAHLPQPLTYEKFGAMMKEAGVEHAILVPPSWEGDRVDYSLEAAQKYPDRFAVMGRFPINKPKERSKLETWRDQKGMLGGCLAKVAVLSEAALSKSSFCVVRAPR
jgi:predicted TIM-barrel fold metal-dependent hydrolase